MKEFSKMGARYSLTHKLKSESNNDTYSPQLTKNGNKEADTSPKLLAAGAARTDPFTEYYIYSPDTDVLILLIHHYQMLPQVSTQKCSMFVLTLNINNW